MGACISKSNNLQKQGNNPTNADKAPPNMSRRRLSVSQSAEARPVKEEEENRGSTFLNLLENEQHILSMFNQAGRRMSITGMPAHSLQRGFDNKAQEQQGEGINLPDIGVGYTCRKGLKPESPNQDDFFILRIDDWGLYGVFDGHGPYGHDISHFAQSLMPKLVCTDPHFNKDPLKALRNSFLEVNRLIEQAASVGKFDCSLSGSTGTVVLHRPREKKLYVAHVGDSRCILARNKGGNRLEAVDLTLDHKPNLEAEKKRIVAHGGQVRRLDGDIPYRVFLKGKLYPGLAMSRALGDLVGGQAGVIADPDVSEFDLSENRDVFIILCSDGVWEFIQSQEAVDLTAKHAPKKVQDAADQLASESWNRWINEEHNVVDDITVQIVYLFPSSVGLASGSNSMSITAAALKDARKDKDAPVSSGAALSTMDNVSVNSNDKEGGSPSAKKDRSAS